MTDHQRLNQLKTKQEMDQYDITIDHKEVLSLFYDYYMEFSPTSVKRIFLLFFPLNKLFKLLLVYCLFYHSIWWLPNSTSNNLAINYSNINSFAFIILLYFNFYELLISFLFIRSICFNCLNRLRLIPVVRLKSYLNLIELLLYSFFNLIIFYYFKFILNISFKLLFLIQLPHLLIYFHNNFDISLKLFNLNIFSNESFIKKLNQNEYHQQQQQELAEVVSCKSTSLTYTDCSNLSIKTFLNQPLAMPTLLTSFNQIKQTQKLNPATNPSEQSNQTLKIIKQSVNRAKTAKSRAINISIILFELPRQLMTNTKLKLNNLYQSTIKSFKSFVLNIPKANRFTIKKRNIFDYNFTNDSTTYIQHLCQKNAMGLREECNWFSFEFKNRFKQALIYTFESIYYNFFITRLFVPTDVYIRENDYAMYLTSSIISTFISFWLYYIPFSFLKKLSNNAEHLGYWCRVPDVDDKLPTTKWINTKNYYYGDRVVYMGKIYEANTNHCAAVPSNRFYYIYYLIFANPARTVRILLCFKLLNILILLLLIYLNRRWYAIALSILEVICNSHLFFILMRDFFIFYDGQNYKYKKFK